MKSKVVVFLLSASVAGTTTGCAGTPMNTLKEKIAAIGGCAVGGFAGYQLAQRLAENHIARNNLSGAQAVEIKRMYTVGLALAGCGVVGWLSGTAVAKLSEAGKKRRQEATERAIAENTTQEWTDPENPEISGTTTPAERYVGTDGRECVTTRDVVADQTALSNFCRNPETGAYEIATT